MSNSPKDSELDWAQRWKDAGLDWAQHWFEAGRMLEELNYRVTNGSCSPGWSAAESSFMPASSLKCTCGSDSVPSYAGFHSDWCDKYIKRGWHE